MLGVLDLALNLESVDHEVGSMKFRVLLVTGVEVTLISLFIIFFTRRFLGRPIDKLIEGTKAISQMELDKPLDIVGSSEELDELARSFDVMRDRLRTALGEINQFTQNLETKVEERTQQLKAAQKKLLQSDRLASLGQLSASVAHEINNPVSGVLNLSMLLQRMLKDDGIPPERIEEFRKYLGAGDQRDRPRGPHRLGPAGLFAPLQAAARAGRPQQDRAHDALPGAAQDEAQQRGGGDHLCEDLARRRLRPLADPAGGAQPGAERRRSHAQPSRSGASRCPPPSGHGDVRLHRLPITAKASRRKTWPRSSTRSSPPSRKARAWGLGWRCPTESLRRTAAISKSRAHVGEGTTFTVSLPLEPPAARSEAAPAELARKE